MKKSVFLLWLGLTILMLGGCRLIRIEEEPRTEVTYQIVEEEKIPKALQTLIDEKKDKEFRMTYQDGKLLYLVRGYGCQMSGGYSFSVEELSRSSNGIFFKTQLLGPQEPEQLGVPSYPYIVVKLEYCRDPVNFL